MEHSVQQDSTSCGVLVCKYAYAYVHDTSMVFDTKREAIAHYRKRIWRCLVRSAVSPHEICAGCGEQDLATAAGTGKENEWVSLTII